MQLRSHPVYPRPYRRATLSLAAAVAAVLASQQTHATILTWDADNGVAGAQDGLGTWDNQNLTNWWDGTANAQWNSATPDAAVFGANSGAAGTVTLGSNVTVGNITFSAATSGTYTIAGGGNTLTLSSTTISGTAGALISANLAGTTGLATTNTGTIRLSGANTYTGATSVLNGTLQIDSTGALGGSTQISAGTAAVAGSLLVNVPDSTSTTIGAGKTITIFGSGVNNFGALRGADGASNTWAGNVVVGTTSAGSRISGGNNGTLNVTGVISGTSPLTFSRNTNATTVLSAVNTYTGDTQIFNSVAGSTATLKIGVDNAINAGSRLVALSAVAAGPEVVDLNGHLLTFRALDTSLATTAASSSNLMVTNNGAAPSTLTVGDPVANTGVFGGSVRDGTGVLSLIKNGVNTQILVGANTYTGTTTVNGGTLQLGAATPTTGNIHFTGSNAVLASQNIALNGGALVIDNTGNLNNNNTRLPDSADITFVGGRFSYKGSDQAATDSTETIHNLVLSSGHATIGVTPGGTNAAILNANQLVRAPGGGAAFVNGTTLGKDGTSTTSVARLLLATAPPLVGTTTPLSSGINSGAQNTQIVPFLIGEAAAGTGGLGTVTGTPNTFLTFEATTGLRPLNPTDEFTNNAIVAGNNTRITSATTASTTAAINSLVVNGNTTLTISASQTLTDTSGALLFVSSNSTITGGTLDFGTSEGIISVTAAQTGVIGSKITGSNGLTFCGPGTLGVGSADSTYTGGTTVRSGFMVAQTSTVGPAGAVTSGPFGTGTIFFVGGGTRATSAGPVTVGNSITLQADLPIAAGGNALTLSGPVTLANGTRTITNNTTGTASKTTFSGAIGDGGQNLGLSFAGAGTNPIVLSGANTYTGPTKILSGTVIVSGSLSGSSLVTVGNSASLATTAMLGGSGSLGPVFAIGSGNPATSGATVDPGNLANIAGILNPGTFSLTNGAHLNLQIGGTTAGGETNIGYDQVAAAGPVTLTGGDLKLSLLGTPFFNLGDQLYLVVNNSGSDTTGTFATLNGTAFDPSDIVLGGQQFQLTYTANFAGPGSDGMANDVALVAVPEPGSLATLIGAMGLLGLARSRRGRIA